jgi:hypothetical protein
MPKKLRMMENAFVTCYHIDEEKTYTENVMKESHDNSLNLPHDVCNMKISFNDEDLLVGSKLHNHPLFIKRYVDEKIMNCILVDDGLIVNILPYKTMIPINELSLSYLMIQSFNKGGQNVMGKIRLAIHMEYMESNALFHVIDVVAMSQSHKLITLA